MNRLKMSFAAAVLLTIWCQRTVSAQVVTSNTQFIFSASVYDERSSRQVGVVGGIHLQTKFHRSSRTVEVQANLGRDVITYLVGDPVSTSPLLQQLSDLRSRIQELTKRIVDLAAEIGRVEQEIWNVMHTDAQPLVPGHQIDRDALNRLYRRLAELSAELEQAQQELKDVKQQIRAVLDELNKMQDPFKPRYSARGVARSAPAPFEAGEEFHRHLTFILVRPDGSCQPFEMLFTLKFTDTGVLRSADCGSPEDP